MKKIPVVLSGLLASLGTHYINTLMKESPNRAIPKDAKEMETVASHVVSEKCPYIVPQSNPDTMYYIMGSAMIGRFPYNDISIPNDKSVSRIHCRIFMKNGIYYMVDLGAKGGTKVNGKSVPLYNSKKESDLYLCKLQSGDKITIGKSIYIFYMGKENCLNALPEQDWSTTTIIG